MLQSEKTQTQKRWKLYKTQHTRAIFVVHPSVVVWPVAAVVVWSVVVVVVVVVWPVALSLGCDRMFTVRRTWIIRGQWAPQRWGRLWRKLVKHKHTFHNKVLIFPHWQSQHSVFLFLFHQDVFISLNLCSTFHHCWFFTLKLQFTCLTFLKPQRINMRRNIWAETTVCCCFCSLYSQIFSLWLKLVVHWNVGKTKLKLLMWSQKYEIFEQRKSAFLFFSLKLDFSLLVYFASPAGKQLYNNRFILSFKLEK